jgi:hypothetical protein
MARVTEIFAQFFAPLLDALEDFRRMEALLSDLGIDVPLTAAHELVFRDILPVLEDLQHLEAVALASTGEDDPSDLEKAAVAIELLSALAQTDTSDIQSLPGTLSDPDTWLQIARELPGYLLLTWLDDVYPVATAAMKLGGAIDTIPRGPGQPPRNVINWEAVAQLALNPPEQISQTWNFGGNDFDSDGFLTALAELIQALGGAPRLVRTPQIVLDAMDDRVPDGVPLALDGRILDGSTPNGVASGLFSLVMTAASRPGQGGRAGLAVMPMVSGAFSVSEPLDEDEVTILTLDANGTASGGAGVALYPDDFDLILGTASASAAARFGISAAPEGGWVLIGKRSGSHLRLDHFAFDVTVTTSPPSIGISLNAEDAFALAIKASPDGDGLINQILGDVEVEVFGGLTASWSTDGGWVISGGAGLEVEIPIGRTLGPFTLNSITVMGAAGTDGFATGAWVTGAFSVGPLHLGFEDIGVIADLVPMPDGQTGTFGALDVQPRFKPPSGYSVGLDVAPIVGGGLISISDTEYRGALALAFESIGFSAFAILNTRLPGGEEGFSFAGSIFCEFTVPLAFGFSLTGVGGFIGINRTIDTIEMREVLYAGRLDDLLFPADPIGAASQILDDMAAIMPPALGQHVIGPVVRISWGQPRLVDITMGVLLEIGQDMRIVILGGVAVVLPDDRAALISLKLQFMGEIDFSAGSISFDATLEGSRVLVFAVDGDVAVRTGWGRGITQVASFGGLHPDYPKPDNLPDLARLSISFGTNNPRFSLSSYKAVTYNSIQAGARIEMYAKGPKVKFVGQVAAEGFVAFDALVYFNPFRFKVGLRGGLSILVDGEVKAGLYFSLDLEGPNSWYVAGEVWVKVLGVKVRFAVTHRWGERESETTFVASPSALLRTALETSEGFRPVGGITASPAVTFRRFEEGDRSIDPIGGLEFLQTAVPLDVTLERIGEAEIEGAAKVDLAVYRGGQQIPVTSADSEFVRGHFFDIKKSERLSDPVFEEHKAGFSFSDTALVAAPSSVVDEYEHEIFLIPVDDGSAGPVLKSALKKGTFSRVAKGQLHASLRSKGAVKAGFASATPMAVESLGFVTEEALSKAKDKLQPGEDLGAALRAQGAHQRLSVARRDSGQAASPVASYIAA